MWARYIELLLGAWLIAAPFLLGPERTAIEITCGALIILFAAMSFSRRFRAAHRINIIVSLVLAAAAYLGASHPATAAEQNDIVAGLLILMFAIVPSEASLPPHAWPVEA
jgi:hypothetical protein